MVDGFILAGTHVKEAVDASGRPGRRVMFPGLRGRVPEHVNSVGTVDVAKLAKLVADYLDAVLASREGTGYTYAGSGRGEGGLGGVLAIAGRVPRASEFVRTLAAVGDVSWVVVCDGDGIRKTAVAFFPDLP